MLLSPRIAVKADKLGIMSGPIINDLFFSPFLHQTPSYAAQRKTQRLMAQIKSTIPASKSKRTSFHFSLPTLQTLWRNFPNFLQSFSIRAEAKYLKRRLTITFNVFLLS